MQTTRRKYYAARRDARLAAQAMMEGSLSQKEKRRRISASKKRPMTEYQLECQAKNYIEQAMTQSPAQLALVPDYRPGVEAMRARIAAKCGPLQPLGRRGWTA